jgi:hypothetical protein
MRRPCADREEKRVTRESDRSGIEENVRSSLTSTTPIREGSQIPAQLAQRSSGISFSSQNQIASFFSSEAGRTALANAEKQVNASFAEVERRLDLRFNLSFDWVTGLIGGE